MTTLGDASAVIGRARWDELLFEEVFEGLAGVERTAGSGLRSGGDLRGLLVGGWRGVLFNGHSEFVEFAGVFAVFWSDAFGDGLHTFKLRAGIEKAALFAAVEFGVAFRAGAVGVEARGENRAAIGAAGTSDGANHAGSAGAEMIVLSAGTALRRLAFWAGLLFFFGIAVTAMAILAIHNTSVHWPSGKTSDGLSRHCRAALIEMETGG
jgi:hypothetical protein